MNFLDDSIDITQALPGSYNLALVLLSYLPAVFAAYATLNLALRIREMEQPQTRYIWMGTGATAMGVGIWSMHFIGMLAFTMPMPILFDPAITLLSVAPAIFASTITLAVLSRPGISIASLFIGGVFMGGGIGAMHYTGMAAMRMNAVAFYQPGLFVASILVGVMLAVVALYINFLPQKKGGVYGLPHRVVSALVMGLAVTGMHYTAMTASNFFPADSSEAIGAGLDPVWLGILVSVGAFLVISLAMVASFAEYQLSSRKKLTAEMARRKETEKQLQQSNAALEQQVTIAEEQRSYFESVIKMAVDGIIIIDRQGTIENFNPAAEQLFGYAEAEVLGQNIKMLMPEPYHSAHDGYLQNYLDTGVARIIGIGREVSGLRKDGTTFPLELAVSEMLLPQQRMFTGIVRDITERKNNENSLLQAMDEAQAGNRAKSQFLANMSHELRTPLNAVIGYSELLKETAEADQRSQDLADLNRIYTAGNDLLRLVDNVLELARIEDGKMLLSPMQIDVAPLLERLISSVMPLVEKNGSSLSVRHEDMIDSLFVDQEKLYQCLFNLLSNAAKFTAGGKIDLSIEAEQKNGTDWIVFRVQDSGIGISAEQLSGLMQPFSQVDNSATRQYDGSGVGLALSRLYCQLMSGDMTVESEVGVGSIFTLRLPLQPQVVTSIADREMLKSDQAGLFIAGEDGNDRSG